MEERDSSKTQMLRRGAVVWPLLIIVAVSTYFVIKNVADTPDATISAERPAAGQSVTPSVPAGASGLPRLLDLGSTQCIPCKAMAPILDELAETFDGEFEVVFIDVREDREAGAEHGVTIIPTQIFFDAEGNELFRHQGFYSREDILAKWREFGFEFEG